MKIFNFSIYFFTVGILIKEGFVKRGVNPTRRNGIAPNAMRAIFKRGIMGKARDSAFRRAVNTVVRVRPLNLQ